ncbi:MAG TPA: fumarylacetoacetate hydrolase family protein [Vicinamibacterales bacterium]|jgi:acylpyruvate hydrolase|nr:fumarylacetoacetate hydrolase family protein [Vicinamibacterales bacterium]
MRLVTYSRKGGVALGALLADEVADLHRAHRAALKHRGDLDELAVAALRIPPDLVEFLQGGEASLAAARRALAFVEQQRAAGHAPDLCDPLADVELLAPVLRPGKVVCLGLNYRSHLAEIGEPASEYPILFTKAATSLIGHGQPIVLPRISRQVDYEGELAVVIGRRGKYIPEKDALSHVAGYTCANDVSANDIEFRTSQWTSGKMLDTFCPLGPVLVTRDEIPNPGALRIKTVLNGKTVQDGATSDMVFSVPFLVSYISSLATLEPGDLILTGTPAGIGCNQRPPVFLQPGDRISIQIDGIGTLTNPVAAEAGR